MPEIQRAIGWVIILWGSVWILSTIAGWVFDWYERRRVRRILRGPHAD